MSASFVSRMLLIGATLAGASSCMPNYTFIPCGDGVHPAVCFVHPNSTMDNPEIITETEGPMFGLTVQLVVSNFDLRPPTESCQGANNCGHIHLVVTSRDANDPTNPDAIQTCNVLDHPYNQAGSELQQTVTFGTCMLTIPNPTPGEPPLLDNHGMVRGPHSITAELHLENHQAVPGADSDTVFVIVMDPRAPGP